MSRSDGPAIEGNFDAFERCDDCGGIHVAKSAHRCPTGRMTGESAEKRRRLRELDDQPDDEMVLVLRRSKRQAIAYHVPHALDPEIPRGVCRAQLPSESPDEWVTMTRAEAKRLRLYPCTYCHDREYDTMSGDWEGDME